MILLTVQRDFRLLAHVRTMKCFNRSTTARLMFVFCCEDEHNMYIWRNLRVIVRSNAVWHRLQAPEMNSSPFASSGYERRFISYWCSVEPKANARRRTVPRPRTESSSLTHRRACGVTDRGPPDMAQVMFCSCAASSGMVGSTMATTRRLLPLACSCTYRFHVGMK